MVPNWTSKYVARRDHIRSLRSDQQGDKYICRKLTFSAFQRYKGLGVWHQVILSKNALARHIALLTFSHFKTLFVNGFFFIIH